MTFERPAWLVLLLLVAVYGLVYWFARRYWSARVTYGELWQRVANTHQAPRALIRRLLTLAFSVFMLGCVVLALAKPYIDEPPPPPADIVILLDTSVSTVRQYQDQSTLDAL
ncbi:MAG: BatA domain-containing protein, partial [Planctomycetes bacterium]|nr:BatA domain-containing protein [Planctomycetota bacterium]